MIENNLNEIFLLMHERNVIALQKRKARNKMNYWKKMWELKRTKSPELPEKHKKTSIHKLKTIMQGHKANFERANYNIMRFTEENSRKLKRLLKAHNAHVGSDSCAGYSALYIKKDAPADQQHDIFTSIKVIQREEITQRAIQYKANKIAERILLTGRIK